MTRSTASTSAVTLSLLAVTFVSRQCSIVLASTRSYWPDRTPCVFALICPDTLPLSPYLRITDVFHRCFEHHDNEQIFEVEGGPLVQSVLSGYNGTLIAYGQTGSGKTHTIAGVDGDEGQMPRLLRRLFDEISDSPDFLWDVSLQYLQVYNDQAFDLLPAHNGGDADAPLRVREETEGTIVDGAASVKLACCEEGLWALASGSSNQKVAPTGVNRLSSCAHSIAVVSVTRQHSSSVLEAACAQAMPGDAALRVYSTANLQSLLDSAPSFATLRAKLTVVDLAGSERIGRPNVIGQTPKEARHIKSSLLALGTVVDRLAMHSQLPLAMHGGKKAPHAPFRESTLTRLLQDSFGGNCRTSLIICCSPAKSDAVETKSALLFGQRAMLVKNTTHQNVVADNHGLAHHLQKQLNAAEARTQGKCHQMEAEKRAAMRVCAEEREAALAEAKAAKDKYDTALVETTAAKLVVSALEQQLAAEQGRAQAEVECNQTVVKVLEESAIQRLQVAEASEERALAAAAAIQRVERERDAALEEHERLRAAAACCEEIREQLLAEAKKVAAERARADSLQATLTMYSETSSAVEERDRATAEAASAKDAATAFKRQVQAERESAAAQRAAFHMTWRGVLLLLLLCATAVFGLLRSSGASRRPGNSSQACLATLNDVCPDWHMLKSLGSPS
jgi:kinesin family member 5